MKEWDQEYITGKWLVNAAIDKNVCEVQREGHEKHPESFRLAEMVCASYDRQTGTMTEVQRYDFRRAFEMGYRFAMLKRDASNKEVDRNRIGEKDGEPCPT